MTRRNFAVFSLASLAVAGGAGFLIGKAKPRIYLRPPGAAERFESLCIKCGQCVQVCPYHSIELLGVDDGLNLGTAFIDASKRGCYLCDLFPCVLACPSGALQHSTTEISDVKMGVAVLREPNKCLAYNAQSVEESHISQMLARKTYNEREDAAKQILADNIGQECALCVNSCPVEGALIFAESSDSSVESQESRADSSDLGAESRADSNDSQESRVDSKKIPAVQPNCVGCGVCEEVCFAGVIEIVPQQSYEQIYQS